VLIAPFVRSSAYVSPAVARLVCVKVVEALRSVLGQRAVVTVMRIEAVIDVSVKAVRAVKPGAGSDKHSANKPIGAIVAVGSAIVRGIVEVTVGADGSWSDIYADGDLGLRYGRRAQKASYENCENEHAEFGHDFLFIVRGFDLDYLGPA
jgi:hypothetical protein